MDFNITKFNIPIHIKKAFDKGEIDKVYKEMYFLADDLAVIETKRYMARKGSEFLDQKIRETKGGGNRQEGWASKTSKQISVYRDRRLKYHIDNMYKLLELYTKAKTTTSPE